LSSTEPGYALLLQLLTPPWLCPS